MQNKGAPNRWPEKTPIEQIIHIIYYCMTGRAIQGNIQFEGGSIVPHCGRANTATLELNIPLYYMTRRHTAI